MRQVAHRSARRWPTRGPHEQTRLALADGEASEARLRIQLQRADCSPRLSDALSERSLDVLELAAQAAREIGGFLGGLCSVPP